MNLVVIPAHNEAATVDGVVRAARAAVEGAAILVVDDQSSDDTARIAADAGAMVVATAGQHGYGAALMRGFRHAIDHGFHGVVTLDADGQHDPGCLPALLARLGRCDIVSGSRYHEQCGEGVGHAPPERRRINHEITARLNALTGWALTDAFCGLKAYRVETLRGLFLDEVGYGFPLQLWVEAWRAGLSVSEMPVPKIYLPVERCFGDGLDDADARCAYYAQVLERALARTAAGCAGGEDA